MEETTAVAEADSVCGGQRGGKATAEKGLATDDGGSGSRSCRNSAAPRESDAGERPDKVYLGAGLFARGAGGTGDAGGDGGRRCFSGGTGDTAGTGDTHGDDCYDRGTADATEVDCCDRRTGDVPCSRRHRRHRRHARRLLVQQQLVHRRRR